MLHEMTSLRTATEITGASFALIALFPMTALLPAQTAPRGTVAINGRASEIERERREAGSAACASQARP